MDLRDDIKQNASHWVISCHSGYECWREIKLVSANGRVLWGQNTPRYRKGDWSLRYGKASARAEGIILNFEGGYQLGKLRREIA